MASPPRLLRVDPGVQNHVGVPIVFTVTAESMQPQSIRLRLRNDKGTILNEREAIINGKRCMVVQYTPGESGMREYRIELQAAAGTGNLAATRPIYDLYADVQDVVVHVAGPPKILIVDPFPDEAVMLKSAIAPLHIGVDICDATSFPDIISDYAAVILNDLSGNELTDQARATLKQFVHSGGGLIFIGGENCVASRWKTNPLAELLPFTITPPTARIAVERPKVAVCYVLDRSGSMSGALGGGVSKLDIVKASVQASLRDLPDEAVVSVVVFDGKPDVVVPPTPLSQRTQIQNLLDKVQVGGGTNMPLAIGDALDTLRKCEGEKYMVVLTDGQTEAPPSDNWQSYLDEAAAGKVHWTSIAVGADADTALMKRLADGSNGSYYFCGDGNQIPKVFVTQARTVRRKASATAQPFSPKPGPAIDHLKDIPPLSIPQLRDSLSTDAKPGTDTILIGRDATPLLSQWRYGLGTVIAFASDAKGAWSEKWVRWDGTSRFWSQVVQKCLRPPAPFHITAETRDAGDQVQFVFAAIDDDGRPLADLTCQATIAEVGNRKVLPADTDAVQWSSPRSGEYVACVSVAPGSATRMLQAQLTDSKGHEVIFAASLTGRRSPEISAGTGPDQNVLQAIAQAGHGVVSRDASQLAAAYRAPIDRNRIVLTPVWPYVLGLAVALWLLDILIRKLTSV